jgi:hypothetical protein
MNSALVELEDGERVITSRYAVRLLLRKPQTQNKERDAAVRRWLKTYAPFRLAELGVQKQLFSSRGVRVVQLTSVASGKPALVIPKRQYQRVARLLALQACCVWERMPIIRRCACVPCLSLQG